MNTTKVLRVIHPKSFVKAKTLIVEFDNKLSFVHWVMGLQLGGNTTDNFVKKFLASVVKTPELEGIENIKNNVRNNLIKRRLISENIYSGYTYELDGVMLDPSEVVLGNPKCYLAPVLVDTKYFYELYVNMSIAAMVSADTIQTNVIKLIETIKLLESRNIQIKVNIIDYGADVVTNDGDYKDILIIVPICSHTDFKSYKTLYPFFSEAMERGPLFKVAHLYNDSDCVGNAETLDSAINLWRLDEVKLAERVIRDVGIPTEV